MIFFFSTVADEAVSIQNNQIKNHVGRACSNARISWPVSPVRSRQNRHTPIQSVVAAPRRPDQAIWFPVWQMSHPEHVDLPDSKIEMPDFLSEFQHFWGEKINVILSRQTTHVRVHAEPHAKRTYPGIALIDMGFPQQRFVQVRSLTVESVRRID